MITSITKDNFQSVVMKNTKPVVLDVYATWCGPCQLMEPHVEELAQEFDADYVFAKLNVDEAREISISLGVSSVPTFLFIKDGNVVARHVGYMSKEDLRERIEEAFE